MPPTLRGKVTLAITLHFFVALRRALLHHVAALRKSGPENPMKLTLLAAIADSIATSRCVRVAIPFLGIKDAVRFIERNFHDVDWDPFPDRITIFGDDPSVPCDENGDGLESHFVLEILR